MMHWIYAHLIGDFLLQNDWMAKQKKVSSLACTVHVLVYMAPFIFCGLAAWQLGLIALQHWVQDRTGLVVWLMRITGKKESGFLGVPMAPWSVIVTDQILHVLFIAAVVSYGR